MVSKFVFVVSIVIAIFITAIFIGAFQFSKREVVVAVNQPPIIEVPQILNGTVNQPLIINATVSDKDGVINSIIWDQEQGPKANFTQLNDDLYFVPTVNGSYIFRIEAQDNRQAITTSGVIVNVVKPEEPGPECEPDERIVDGKCVEIPRPTCTPDQIYNATNNTCIPKPVPTPTPTPTPTPVPGAKDLKIAVVGDVDRLSSGGVGEAVFNQINKLNPSYVVVLGDLGYDDDLSAFKKTYGTLGDRMFCLTGNHESDNEDGSASIEKETLEYCGNSYWLKVGVNIFFMFNTNADLKAQQTKAIELLGNSTTMKDVKNIHIFSHKPCVAPPNSHHPVESAVKSFCDAVKSKIPSTIKVFYTQAHNHVMSESSDKQYKQSGAGGRSHYTCPSSTSGWWCNNTVYGFVVYNIKADGTTTSQWIDSTGKVIR